MADLLQDFKDLEEEQNDLRSRMDTDKDLVEHKTYEMTDWANKAVKKAINVTLNKPGVFAWNVESALNNATEQVNIETEDKKIDKDHIADFVRAAFDSDNSYANMQGKWPLNPFIDQQMCRRGRGGLLVVSKLMEIKDASGKAKKVLRVIIRRDDSRYSAWDTGAQGLSLYGYRSTRSKKDILADYPDLETKLGTKKSAQVVDIWTPEQNAVYVDDALTLEQPNPFGFVPACGQIVTLGAMTADDDANKFYGESIFFLIRNIIPEKNRLISIMQTLNTIGIKPPKEWQSQNAEQDAPQYDDVMAAGSITPSEVGGGIKDINFGDLKNSAIYSLNIIDNALNEGSMDVVNVGDIPAGGLSAVALIQIGEGQDQVFLPRLGARGLLKQQAANMVIRQVKALGESRVELGPMGRERTFDVKKLEGAYDIEYKYFVKSPKIDLARYSMAQVAQSIGIPQEDIDRDILQLEDPQGTQRRRSREKAAALSPLIEAMNIIKDLSETGDDDDKLKAEILAEQFNMDLDRTLAGETPAMAAAEKPKAQPGQLMPLLNDLERPNSAKEAAQLQGTPRGGNNG